MNITTVGIVTKPRAPEVAQAAARLADWFEERGVGVLLETETAQATAEIAVQGLGEFVLVFDQPVDASRQTVNTCFSGHRTLIQVSLALTRILLIQRRYSIVCVNNV